MPKAKVKLNLKDEPVTAKIAQARQIVTAMTGNAHYPEPWAAQVPTLEQLSTAFDAYRDAYHASLTRDTLKIAQRDSARQIIS